MLEVFLSGRPTRPDVEKLLEKFPSLNAGDKIEYQTISDIISEPVKSSRFRTVIQSWRRLIRRQKNILLEVVPNVGFIVMNNSQRVNFTNRKFASGLKIQVRAGDDAMKTGTDGLTQSEMKSRDHVVRCAAAIKGIAATESKKLTFELKSITESKAA